jgi:hypothetical protein
MEEPSAKITILERLRDLSYRTRGMPNFISGRVDRIGAETTEEEGR